MMRITTVLLTISLVTGVFAASGCISFVDWHENFVSAMRSKIGMKHGALNSWVDPKYLISSLTLPNNNVAYEYRYGAACRYTFEVNPKTDIVVATRWAGEAKDCVLRP